MTASAPRAPRPGRAAVAGRPVGALWSLLLVGLLTVVPCAGNARAVTPEAAGAVLAPLPGPPAPDRAATANGGSDSTPDRTSDTAPDRTAARTGAAAPSAVPVAAPDRADRQAHRAPHGHNSAWQDGDGPDHALCSAVDDLPRRGNGCSRHPYCAQESQLPNAPPQPVPAALPRLVTLGALPPSVPVSAPAAHLLAPDLHELQIQRS
ncbi:hypothetical protein [Kitasatospora sp. NPDC057015]|uniref:hypothetical protein n=1 Tax=Kitasatospora sp. NPDC057015 TaxID=3346001 RepID=UPI003624CA6A